MATTAAPPQHTLAKPVHHTVIPRWLTHLGALGLFAVAALDSSVIPLPLPGSTDLLLLWLVSHHGDPGILTACAIAGSVLGGYTCWSTGRRGGEAALGRYVSARMLKRVSRWVENHAILSVFLPAMLPPPFPLTPFLLAAGALGVSRKRFFQVFTAARTLRFAIVTWLGIRYGRGMVRLWSGTLEKWSPTLLWLFAGISVCGVAFGIWKLRRGRKSYGGEGNAVPA